MTRREFVDKAVRVEEKRLGLPAGWWGTWRDVRGPNYVRVRFSGDHWVLSYLDKVVSKHDSRSFAISKGKKL